MVKPSQHLSRHDEAIVVYEQAIRTLHQHNYAKAAELLRHLTTAYAEARDLGERCKLYLALCERHLQTAPSEPHDTEERLLAATIALNAGNADAAISHLNRVLADEPANDQGLYMLAVAYSEKQRPEVAIRYLRQAIEANPENRSLARLDPDLDTLRGDARFIALFAPP